MSQEWNIRSRGHFCSICQKPLVDKTPVVSALKEVGDGYERFDCHPECWKTGTRDWQPFSLWDSVYLAPVKEEKEEPLKKEDAGELLRQLVTLDDPAMKNVVYVLAVMLERAKILVERDQKLQDDGTIRRAEVQQQVVALLSGTKTLGEVASEEEGAPPSAGGDEAQSETA